MAGSSSSAAAVSSGGHFGGVAALLTCVVGIYGAYLTQGVVQETLSTKRYGAEAERFDHLPALTALQSWACFVWALSLLRVAPASLGGAPSSDSSTSSSSSSLSPPPIMAYWRPAVSNSIGPACGLQALRYISYPAQVLAKSSKMIPVMLVGTVLHGKRYPALEYACCAAVSAGVSLFALRSSSKAKSRLASPNAPLGYSLCLANLILDGYTNAAQDEIHRKHPGGSPLHMMAWMNFWCGLFYLPALFVLSSAGPDLLRFCARHPEAARDVALFCVCGAVGQLFIFYAIKRFGSLTNTIITTTRKFFNILLSALWNGTALLPQQWVAVIFVFVGIAVSSYSKSKAKPFDASSSSSSWIALPVVDADPPPRERSSPREKDEPHVHERRSSPSPNGAASPRAVGGSRAAPAGAGTARAGYGGGGETAVAGTNLKDAGEQAELAIPITPRGLNGETTFKGARRGVEEAAS